LSLKILSLKIELSTGYPQVIHRLSTGYPQPVPTQKTG
jgi:hypothetical protein